jgi:hypothetical protein
MKYISGFYAGATTVIALFGVAIALAVNASKKPTEDEAVSGDDPASGSPIAVAVRSALAKAEQASSDAQTASAQAASAQAAIAHFPLRSQLG